MPIRDPEHGLDALLRRLGLKRDKVVSVAFLPRPASVFEGAVRFQMPQDFRIAEYTREKAVFRGKDRQYRLTVTVMHFAARLSRVKAEDLTETFSSLLHVSGYPQLRRSKEDKFTALRADWAAEGCVLYLIQVQQTAAVLLWEHIPQARAGECDAMIRSVTVNTARLRAMDQ